MTPGLTPLAGDVARALRLVSRRSVAPYDFSGLERSAGGFAERLGERYEGTPAAIINRPDHENVTAGFCFPEKRDFDLIGHTRRADSVDVDGISGHSLDQLGVRCLSERLEFESQDAQGILAIDRHRESILDQQKQPQP